MFDALVTSYAVVCAGITVLVFMFLFYVAPFLAVLALIYWAARPTKSEANLELEVPKESNLKIVDKE